MATDSPPQDQVLLTASGIARLEDELRAFDRTTEAQRAKMLLRLDVARSFLTAPVLGSEESIANAPHEGEVAGASEKAGTVQTVERMTKGRLWEETIFGIVAKYPEGLSYAVLRSEMGHTRLAQALRESDKAYQRAMSRLAARGAIERAHGRVFTPAAFAVFNSKLESGEASSVVPQAYVRSPMGEAILKIVHSHPGLVGKQIINLLREDPEFHAALTPHETGAFNIIARLARRQQILRRDDGRCVVGPNFPYEELGLKPNKDGALNGYAASAPITGGTAIPPIENQQRLSLG